MLPRLFLRKLWQMNKILPVILGILVLGALVVFSLNAWLLTPDLQELQRTYIAQRDSIRHGDAGKQLSLVKRVQKDRADLAAFRQVVGDYDDFTGFIGELFNLAGKAGLDIDHVRYDPKGIENYNLLRYDLAFSVSGNYGEIKKFIFSLEQSKRIVVIEEVSLAGASKAGSGQVNLQIKLSTYFGTDNT